MSTQFLFWSKVELRRHQAVILGELAPTMVLKNATYLNTARHCWTKANIWIYDNRIVYVGTTCPRRPPAQKWWSWTENMLYPDILNRMHTRFNYIIPRRWVIMRRFAAQPHSSATTSNFFINANYESAFSYGGHE